MGGTNKEVRHFVWVDGPWSIVEKRNGNSSHVYGTPFSPLLQIYRLPALQRVIGIPVLELEWVVFIHRDPMHFQPFDLSTNCVLFAVNYSRFKGL